MPSSKNATVDVACPHCGHHQPEPPSAYSTNCRSCGQYFRVQEALHPTQKAVRQEVEQRYVRCFQCGTELAVPKAAASSMCRKCSSHIDLTDYHVNQTVSKNFRTHGRLTVEEKGYVLNTEAFVGEAVVKGRLIGRLGTQGALEIHTGARITGTLTPGCLVIPAGHHFRWVDPIAAGGAEISGELVASLLSTGTVRLHRSARFFGDIEAANLVVEAGAVFVGSAKIGLAPAPPPEPPAKPEPIKPEPNPVAATRRTRPIRPRKTQT